MAKNVCWDAPKIPEFFRRLLQISKEKTNILGHPNKTLALHVYFRTDVVAILLQIISIFWGQADANWNEAINLSFDFLCFSWIFWQNNYQLS